jgi:CRP-like cAMP-binding protein
LCQGEPADKFYLIREGRVAIEIDTASHHSITIQTIQGGNILGWSWLIPPHYNRFSGRATEDVRAIALDGKCLRGKCEENHDLGYELLKRLAAIFTQRLEETRQQLINIYEKEQK